MAELKTANRAEVEKLVADQRLVSVDDQAQVAKDIEAAVDRLNATTIHATWDEKAEEGTVQATLGKRPFMIAPSSTIDSRSDLAFHLRANGEALQLSVVSESGTKLLATRDLSHVFKGCKVKRYLPGPPAPPAPLPPCLRHPNPPSLPQSSLHLTQHLPLARAGPDRQLAARRGGRHLGGFPRAWAWRLKSSRSSLAFAMYVRAGTSLSIRCHACSVFLYVCLSVCLL